MKLSSFYRRSRRALYGLLALALLAPLLMAAFTPQAAQAKASSQRETNPTFYAIIQNNKIVVVLEDFKYNHKYILKARDVTSGAGAWQKIDTLKVLKGQDYRLGYYLPGKLFLKRYIQVCLKDLTNNQKICRTTLNYGS